MDRPKMVPPVSSSPARPKMVPPVSSSPAGSTGKPKPVPPCDSHCRQDGATLQSGTSTRHQDVPRWGHPSDRARRIGRSLGPRPNLQGKGRMPEPQHGATRQFVTSVRHRPFQVGATRQLGERSVPPPNPGGRSRVVAPSVRNSATPSLLGNGHLVRPLGATPNQRAQTRATRRFAVPPEWYHPSVRGAPNSATPQFSWQSVPTRAGATRQPGTTMCQDGATRWIGPSLGPRPSLSPADVRCHPPIRGAEVTFRLVAYSPSDVPVRSPLSPPCLHATLLTVLAGDPELTASRLDEALLPDPVLTPLA